MYQHAWLDLIHQRDTFYLLTGLAAVSVLFWHRQSRGRLYWPLVAIVAGLEITALGWSVWQLGVWPWGW